jgi:diaminohydroxyphosphoribosylaminopyrimidine deaminase/5-amino-6-(5-phosphoribosylamino)uracil reductase
VRSDDPQLTVRSVKGNDPLRVILDGKLSMPAGARALPALVMTSEGTSARGDLVERGAEIVTVPGRDGRVDLRAMLGTLAARGVVTLLVEGGGDVHGQLLEAGLVDRVALFIAPKIVGAGGVPLVSIAGPDKMEDAWKVEPTEWKRVGDDTLLVGRMIRKI